MQALSPELKVQNRTMKLLKRRGRVALYSVYGPQGLLYGYEVVVIRIRKEHEAFGKYFPETEALPRNEEWGIYGWSFQAGNLAGAEKRWLSLLPAWGAELVPIHQKPTFAPFRGS